MIEFIKTIDHNLFVFLNTFCSNIFFDYFFKFITDTHNLYLLMLFAGILFLIKSKVNALKIIVVVVIAMGISDLIGGQILKPFFGRLRPSHPCYFVEGKHLFFEGANFLFGMKRGGSFPSNHAMNAFAFATVLTLYFPRNFFYFYTFSALVAYSRIYVGVHYPLDIIGGGFLGFIIGMFVYYLFYYIKLVIRNKKRFKEIIGNNRLENEKKS